MPACLRYLRGEVDFKGDDEDDLVGDRDLVRKLNAGDFVLDLDLDRDDRGLSGAVTVVVEEDGNGEDDDGKDDFDLEGW